MDNIP